jgi:hypothetical protein
MTSCILEMGMGVRMPATTSSPCVYEGRGFLTTSIYPHRCWRRHSEIYQPSALMRHSELQIHSPH